MTPLALIRHGPTDWNEQKRLQGHADRRLSEEGRRRVSGWTVPAEFRSYRWVASPLTRAIETADLLGLRYDIEASIIEMDWGDWEGATLSELEQSYGEEVRQRTERGLDLRPHGGESPREVRERVKAWARTIARAGDPTGAVAHQGIIRALLSLATGWEMIGKPPARMEWDCLHLFSVATDGEVVISRLNVSLGGTDS